MCRKNRVNAGTLAFFNEDTPMLFTFLMNQFGTALFYR